MGQYSSLRLERLCNFAGCTLLCGGSYSGVVYLEISAHNLLIFSLPICLALVAEERVYELLHNCKLLCALSYHHKSLNQVLTRFDGCAGVLGFSTNSFFAEKNQVRKEFGGGRTFEANSKLARSSFFCAPLHFFLTHSLGCTFLSNYNREGSLRYAGKLQAGPLSPPRILLQCSHHDRLHGNHFCSHESSDKTNPILFTLQGKALESLRKAFLRSFHQPQCLHLDHSVHFGHFDGFQQVGFCWISLPNNDHSHHLFHFVRPHFFIYRNSVLEHLPFLHKLKEEKSFVRMSLKVSLFFSLFRW